MDWGHYKALCERPDHFSRWAIELTAAAIASATIRARLLALLAGPPIAKPAGHKGGAETDYFQVSMDRPDVGHIVAELARPVPRQDARERRRLNHLRIVWQEYAAFMEGY